MREKLANKKRKKDHHDHLLSLFYMVRKFVVFIIGISVLLFGIILIFTPGPAIIVIPIGLAILATEFIWARQLLKRFKNKAKELQEKTGLKK